MYIYDIILRMYFAYKAYWKCSCLFVGGFMDQLSMRIVFKQMSTFFSTLVFMHTSLNSLLKTKHCARAPNLFNALSSKQHMQSFSVLGAWSAMHFPHLHQNCDPSRVGVCAAAFSIFFIDSFAQRSCFVLLDFFEGSKLYPCKMLEFKLYGYDSSSDDSSAKLFAITLPVST